MKKYRSEKLHLLLFLRKCSTWYKRDLQLIRRKVCVIPRHRKRKWDTSVPDMQDAGFVTVQWQSDTTIRGEPVILNIIVTAGMQITSGITTISVWMCLIAPTLLLCALCFLTLIWCVNWLRPVVKKTDERLTR